MKGVSKWLGRGLAISLVIAFIAAIITITPGLAEDWDKYKPQFSNGSEAKDWWIKSPDQSAKAGSAVEHPKWVLEALKKGPVMIMDHTEDCSSCKIQKKNVEKVLPGFEKEVTYYDLLADGDDKRAYEILNIYSPTGKELFVPTTVFITLMKGKDGKAEVAWHSEIDAMTEELLTSYLKDSIYYYRQNADSWNK